MTLTAHSTSNQTTTEITRHGSFLGRLDTQLVLLKACVQSLRLTEEHCQREVLLLVDDPIYSALMFPALMFPRTCEKSHPTCWSVHPFRSWATRQRIRLVKVPPIMKGVPAADKLHALTFMQYRMLVMLDIDMLVLQDMHRLFDVQQTTMAHHPYDLAQGKHCGMPLASRAVSALIVWQPNITTFADLMSAVHATGPYELQHYSEQLPVVCYFHSRRNLQTLPCSYVYDLAIPRYTHNKGGYHSCRRYGGVDIQTCTAIARHVEAECLWHNTYRQAHAVHFKGTLKPWRLGVACTSQTKLGRMLMLLPQNSSSTSSLSGAWNSLSKPSLPSTQTGTDNLEWSEEWNACISTRRRLQLTWADGKPISRKCCHINTALQVEWRAHKRASNSEVEQ